MEVGVSDKKNSLNTKIIVQMKNDRITSHYIQCKINITIRFIKLHRNNKTTGVKVYYNKNSRCKII